MGLVPRLAQQQTSPRTLDEKKDDSLAVVLLVGPASPLEARMDWYSS
jgi:hypothetical protein